jgi:hypothetical protein
MYMPHNTPHSVHNLASTIAVGDNYLFESSMDEFAVDASDDLFNRAFYLAMGETKDRLKAVVNQVKKAKEKNKKIHPKK